MADLDNNLFVVSPTLQDALVNSSTGLPLSSGVVTFYQDTQRQTLKNVYYQSGTATPGVYAYLPLSNPNTLTQAGCISDPNGNDIIPYLYPYSEADSTIQQAYYVTVVDSGAIPQFVRENFPFQADLDQGDTVSQNQVNLIPNGQFAAHNNLNYATFLPGQFPNALNTGTAPNTNIVIAPGGSAGWYFSKSTADTGTDLITFPFFQQTPANLDGSPHWGVRIQCTAIGTASTFKTLHMRFNNVNRFYIPGQSYTLYFDGISNSFSTPVICSVVNYYGAGGSLATKIPIPGGNFTIPSSGWASNSVPFTFPSTDGASTGPNNDDYVELTWDFPIGSVYDMTLTNFALLPGDILLDSYPQRPDNDVFANGIAGSMPTPDPNGGNLYLPLVLTQTGVTFDSTMIGKPYASDSPSLAITELLLNGAAYVNSAYDSRTGIPYSRLGSYYLNNGYSSTVSASVWKIPQYGTGSNFVTAALSINGTTNVYVSSNTFGVSTNVADGASPSGFTIPASGSINTPSQASTVGVIATPLTTSSILSGIEVRSISRNAAYSAAVTGAVSNIGSSLPWTLTTIENSSVTKQIVQITGFQSVAAGVYTGGKGIQFTNPDGSQFYIWYAVNNSPSTTPGGSGTACPVKLITGDTAADVVYKTLVAIQGGFLATITATASVNNNGYITFSVGGKSYAPWFNVDGGGTAPSLGSAILIPVPISSLGTATQAAVALVNAINSYSYAVPDFRGFMLRGLDTTSGQIWDPDALTRTSYGNNFLGGVLPGTIEYDLLASHQHYVITTGTGGGTIASPPTATGGTNGSLTQQVLPSGILSYNTGTQTATQIGAETRGLNVAVNWVIKY